MKITRMLLVTTMLFSPLSPAIAHDNCRSIVASERDAAEKADWIIEGEVSDIMSFSSPSRYLSVDIEKAKVIYDSEKSSRFVTASLSVDSCFSNSTAVFAGKAGGKLIGKRMRFFGTRLQAARGRSFFYMQPAEQAMPALPQSRKNYVTTKHSPEVAKPGTDGWARVRSTDGPFSIDMPGHVDDVTRMENGQPGFMLRGTDKHGTVFMAVFERSGPNSQLGGTFDSTISKPDAQRIVFKGAEAISTLGRIPGSDGERITHGLWFRVPGGTYMLGVASSKENEPEALKLKNRFFNSLVFE